MTVEHHHKEDDSLIAEWWKSVLKTVKTPPSRATWLVLIVVLLVAALVGSWFWFTASASATNSELWLKKYETPPTTADLERFAQDPNQQGSVQAHYALAETARMQMQAVVNLGSVGRTQAGPQIQKARDAYEKLVRESGDTPALMQESLMGAAKANELLGDLDKAHQFYQQLARDYPNTALAKEADARLKALDDPNSKKEIDALAAEFKPPASPN